MTEGSTKTVSFVASTREKAQADEKAWRLKNPGIREISCIVSEGGTGARFKPKSERDNPEFVITIRYED